MPAAMLAGRFVRSSPVWFRYHLIFNSLTILLLVIVFGLGVGSVSSLGAGTSFSGDGTDTHHKAGLAIFIAVLLQGILGYAAHSTKKGSFVRLLHMPVGILVAVMLYWIVWEGMHDEWAEMSDSATVTPNGVQVLFWVLLMISVLLYVGSLGQMVLSRFRPTPVVEYQKETATEKSSSELGA